MEIKEIAEYLKNLKLPKNYKDLHNVKELLTIAKCSGTINDYLTDYRENFINSFIMNMDEVLEYIPEKDQKKYKVAPGYFSIFKFEVLRISLDVKDKKLILNTLSILNEILSKTNLIKIFILGEDVSDLILQKEYNKILNLDEDNYYLNFAIKFNENLSLFDILNFIDSNNKTYLVDTKNKNIHVIFDSLYEITNFNLIKGLGKYRLNNTNIIGHRSQTTTNTKEIIKNSLSYSVAHWARRDYSLPAYENDVYRYTTTSLEMNHNFCLETNRYLETEIIDKDGFTYHISIDYYNIDENMINQINTKLCQLLKI